MAEDNETEQQDSEADSNLYTNLIALTGVSVNLFL